MDARGSGPTVAEVFWLIVLGGHSVVGLLLWVAALRDDAPSTPAGWLAVVVAGFVAATVVTWRRRAHWRVGSLLGLLLAASGALGFASGGSTGLLVPAALLALASMVWECGRGRAHPIDLPPLDGP